MENVQHVYETSLVWMSMPSTSVDRHGRFLGVVLVTASALMIFPTRVSSQQNTDQPEDSNRGVARPDQGAEARVCARRPLTGRDTIARARDARHGILQQDRKSVV